MLKEKNGKNEMLERFLALGVLINKRRRRRGRKNSTRVTCEQKWNLMLVVVCLKSDEEGHYQMIAWNE